MQNDGFNILLGKLDFRLGIDLGVPTPPISWTVF